MSNPNIVTLRDYFAAAAMAAILSADRRNPIEDIRSYEGISVDAYEQADWMLAVRAKEPEIKEVMP